MKNTVISLANEVIQSSIVTSLLTIANMQQDCFNNNCYKNRGSTSVTTIYNNTLQYMSQQHSYNTTPCIINKNGEDEDDSINMKQTFMKYN